MSSRAKRVKDQIVGQRITTVIQVLSIMQNEADKMSWLQRLRISWSFLWKKNIDVFFEEAKHGRKEDVQASDEE